MRYVQYNVSDIYDEQFRALSCHLSDGDLFPDVTQADFLRCSLRLTKRPHGPVCCDCCFQICYERHTLRLQVFSESCRACVDRSHALNARLKCDQWPASSLWVTCIHTMLERRSGEPLTCDEQGQSR